MWPRETSQGYPNYVCFTFDYKPTTCEISFPSSIENDPITGDPAIFHYDILSGTGDFPLDLVDTSAGEYCSFTTELTFSDGNPLDFGGLQAFNFVPESTLSSTCLNPVDNTGQLVLEIASNIRPEDCGLFELEYTV